MRYRKVIFIVCCAALSVVAAGSWLSYLGQGLAYGDLYGVKGAEANLAQLGRNAMHSLWIAASCEALLIGSVTWFMLDQDRSVWKRLIASVGLALLADVCTYAIIRGV